MPLNSSTLRTVQGLLLHARENLTDAVNLIYGISKPTSGTYEIAARYKEIMNRIDDERRDNDARLAKTEKAEDRS